MMADAMKFVKPREGLVVRNPSTLDIMPVEGMFVEWKGVQAKYWRRRVKCGDCILSTPPSAPRFTKAKTTKEKE